MKIFEDDDLFTIDELKDVTEIFPWDLKDVMEKPQLPLLVDIRDSNEFDALHIKGSLNIPRNILENACDETVPKLVTARNKKVIMICQSGYRSVRAAYVMKQWGFQSVKSLKTGVKGWNDYELPLHDHHGETIDGDIAAVLLGPNSSSTV